MRLLVIEDEDKTAAALERGFREAGYDVTRARRGDEGLVLARSGGFDLVILDIMLPRRDGWEILAELRRTGSSPPVICLTARDTIDDRVRGLDLGADDYVVKPFAFAELLARVRLAMRHGGADPSVMRLADLEVDFVRQRARRGTSELELTAREFALLGLLLRRRGEPLSRREIAAQVWQMPLDGDSNVIDVAIRRLRGKLDDPFPRRLIQTVRGVGYMLDEQA